MLAYTKYIKEDLKANKFDISDSSRKDGKCTITFYHKLTQKEKEKVEEIISAHNGTNIEFCRSGISFRKIDRLTKVIFKYSELDDPLYDLRRG